MRPDPWVKKPLLIANNQQNIATNLHPDFMASAHSDFFQGQTDSGLFYLPYHSGETELSKQPQSWSNLSQQDETWPEFSIVEDALWVLCTYNTVPTNTT